MASDRLVSIQALRAVAALLVVSHHAATIGTADLPAGPVFSAFPAFDEFGCAGVDIFFVISGFVMAHAIACATATESAARFLLRRIVRIAPPFWLACLATAMFTWLASDRLPDGWSLLNSVTVVPLSGIRTFIAHPAPVYLSWTLGFEFLFYLLVSAALAVGRRRLGLVLAGTMIFAGLGLLRQGGWAPLAFSANMLFAEFALGILARIGWEHCRTRLAPVSAMLMAAGVCLFALGLVVNMGQDFNPDPARVMTGETSAIRALVWGVPAFLLVLGASLDTARAGGGVFALSAALGEASYSIYLLHPLTLEALHHCGFASLVGTKAGFVAIALIASATVGWLAFRYVERPLTQILYRKLNGVRRPARPAMVAQPVPLG